MISATEPCWATAGAGTTAKPATAAALAARVIISLLVVVLSPVKAGEPGFQFLKSAWITQWPSCNPLGSPQSRGDSQRHPPRPRRGPYRDAPAPLHGTPRYPPPARDRRRRARSVDGYNGGRSPSRPRPCRRAPLVRT